MRTLKLGLSRKLITAPALEPTRVMSAWTRQTYRQVENGRWTGPSTWAFQAVASAQYQARPTFSPTSSI